MDFDITKHTVFKCLAGSRSYGLHTESSDYDYRGVAIAPLDYYFGLKSFDQHEELVHKGHPNDLVIFNIVKLVGLALQGNPNCWDIIFADESNITFIDPVWLPIREAQDAFLSQRAYAAFSGYSRAQLNRIKTHRKWLLEPPKRQPTREDFKLPSDRKMDINALQVLVNEGYEFDSAVMMTIEREKNYKNALDHWNQYLNWKKNRNPERAKLEEAYGFDGKHGMHLARLSTMCKEILSGQGVRVKRTEDRDFLLGIRNGAMKYDDLVEWAEKIDLECKELLLTTSLPITPDFNRINDLTVEAIEKFHYSELKQHLAKSFKALGLCRGELMSIRMDLEVSGQESLLSTWNSWPNLPEQPTVMNSIDACIKETTLDWPLPGFPGDYIKDTKC